MNHRFCLHIRFADPSSAEIFFYDEKEHKPFTAFCLEGPAPVDFGVTEGQAWYAWVWCWESTQECDEALALVPETVEPALDHLVAKINHFIEQSGHDHAVTGQHEFSLNIQPDLDSIGWKVKVLDLLLGDLALRLRMHQKKTAGREHAR
jgi:hypothetical protein